MKICCTCKEEKELSEFSKNKSTKDGYQYQCKSCVKEYAKANSEKIKERMTKYNKEYAKANCDKIKEYRKEYRETNAKYYKEYYKANNEKIREQRKEYRKENANKIKNNWKEYYKANKNKINAYKNSPAGREINKRYLLKLNLANSKISQRTLAAWAIQVKALTPLCNLCLSTENLHAHHIIHKIERPDLALDVNNGLTLCENCHIKIHRLEASCGHGPPTLLLI